jgi:SAM-dependent methyltransferase
LVDLRYGVASATAILESRSWRVEFHHPLRQDWLDSHLGERSFILDCACGYGRLLAELLRRGYDQTVGADFAEGMLRRSQILHLYLSLRLVQIDGHTLPFRDHCFDAVLLFPLPTCMPMDNEQRALFAKYSAFCVRGGSCTSATSF